jgi:hypothetical protein
MLLFKSTYQYPIPVKFCQVTRVFLGDPVEDAMGYLDLSLLSQANRDMGKLCCTLLDSINT